MERPRLHIDEVDVLRAFQSQGIGRALLGAAADWARTKGLQTLSLTTFRDVPWNAPFYASFGFREWDPAEAPPVSGKLWPTRPPGAWRTAAR